MHGKSRNKQVRRLTRKPKTIGTPVVVVAQGQVRVGKWVLQEGSDGALEAVHSETGDAFVVADNNASGDVHD